MGVRDPGCARESRAPEWAKPSRNASRYTTIASAGTAPVAGNGMMVRVRTEAAMAVVTAMRVDPAPASHASGKGRPVRRDHSS